MYLIIGCGLCGATIAERIANVLKSDVVIIDQRDHIGGNCYDYHDEETNILMNKYGAHLFHTNNERVFNYIQKYGNWIHWQHKVVGFIDDDFFPIPPNINTVNTLCNVKLESQHDIQQWIKRNVVKYNKEVKNSEESALSRVGHTLYEKLFKWYTKKQWNKFPSELNPEVLNRIPIRDSFNEYYFSDKYQVLPEFGYTEWFKTLLNHKNITVSLNTDFFSLKDLESYEKIFYTGPIDAYYKNSGLPKLEYRSINFEIQHFPCTNFFQPNSVVNYPEKQPKFTRIVEYKHFLHQENPGTTIVYEYSCDDGEPYYPVPNPQNIELYDKYKQLSLNENNVYFVGRLANYKYFNMDQAIINAIEFFENLETQVDIQTMTPSSEERCAVLENEKIVIDCYETILRRKPDPEGFLIYSKFLKEGNKRENLEKILFQSDEYKQLKRNKRYLSTFQLQQFNFNDLKIYNYSSKLEILKFIIENYDTFKTTIFTPHKQINDIQRISALYYGSFVQFDSKFFLDDQFEGDVEIFSITKDAVYPNSKLFYEACLNLIPSSWYYTFTPGVTNYQIVVARYQENVAWTSMFDDVLIYNKGDTNFKTIHCTINLLNEGREGGTYLTHIINNYYSLAEYTIFCQGHPFEHSPDFLKLLKHYSIFFNDIQPLTWRWKENDEKCSWFKDINPTGIPPMEIRDQTRFLHFNDCKLHLELLDQNFNCVFPLIWEDGGFNHCLIPRLRERNKIPPQKTILQWVFEKLGLRYECPQYFPFMFAANFGVSKNNIHKHSIQFYTKLQEFLLEDSDHGYILERLWFFIFS